jgi:hypothetical protein
VPERRGRGDAGLARRLADADSLGPVSLSEVKGGFEEGSPQISMVIAAFSRCLGRSSIGSGSRQCKHPVAWFDPSLP